MSILPRARGICPSCIQEIDLGACDIVSGVTTVIDRNTGLSTNKVLKKAPWLRIGQFSLESLDGSFYNQEQAHRRCPREECQYLLPYNIERVHSISLSVVGDLYSGKSHYIASLVRQIKYEWVNAASGSIEIECLTPDIESDFMTRYMGVLYTGNRPVAQTQQAFMRNPHKPQPLVDHPLIYKIKISSRPIRPPSIFNLMIYDTSGEDFNRIDRLVRFARFALNSSAFIFVADPFSMELVYNGLPSHLKAMVPSYAQPDKRRPASQVITEVLASFRRHYREEDVSRLTDIPIAVMLSKADIFTQAVRPSYVYSYPGFAQSYCPVYGFRVDQNDIDNVHQEVKKLLDHYKQVDLLNATSRLGTIQFFATSATSVPPDRPDHFPSVTPWRCLDPLLWIFYQLGFMKKL